MVTTKNTDELLNVLKEARTFITQEELATRVGCSKRTISRWEKGQTRLPGFLGPALEQIIADASPRGDFGGKSFTFIDLFAGIGGLRRGFEPLGGKCIFTSEWNTYALQTYRANYACDHEVLGDITQIDASQIPEHDILLAGFPCQPFSIAGVSKKNSLHRPHGFHCEAQGTLFFDVARILEYHRPKAFLLENVKNLVNHDKGQTFRIIHRILTETLGYTVRCQVLDAKSWVPQHRERIFIVGFREKNDFSFDDFDIPDPLAGPRLGSILHPEDGTEAQLGNNRKYLDANGRVLDKYTLTDALWNYLQGYAQKHREKGNGFGCSVVGRDDVSRTLSARYYKDGSEILIGQEDRNPRRLTPRECARLMGFDRPGKSDFVIPVSDTQAYRQFGNAVVVPAVEAVARHMLAYLPNESMNPVCLRRPELIERERIRAIG